MSKLYVIGIGGTGSRVLYSLTMLLAAGVPIKADEIIPLIIDTDSNNGNLEDCKTVIKEYNKLHSTFYPFEEAKGDDSFFFRTKIKPPEELNVSGQAYKNLEELLQYNQLNNYSESTKHLIDLFFTKENRKMNLEHGFLGNPNVGSIVLQDVVNTQEFRNFAQAIVPSDRIFIISSIFGGTGAAGFPLLIKLFRDKGESKVSEDGVPNRGSLNEAIIGALTVLPYFEVDIEKYKRRESSINSNTFITKTKAALSYYEQNIAGLVNSFYYIGDYRKSQYTNVEGGTNQRNQAHFIEVASALALVDFMARNPNKTRQEELDRDARNKFYEFGIKENKGNLDFRDLDESNIKYQLREPLTRFTLFSIYMTNFINKSLKDSKLAWSNEIKIDKSFFNTDFYRTLNDFVEKYYYYWLNDLTFEQTGVGQHQRKFHPFNLPIASEVDYQNRAAVKLKADKKALNGIRSDRHATLEKGAIFGKKDIDFDNVMNSIVDRVKEKQTAFNITGAPLFINLVANACNHIYEKHYKG